MDITLKSTKKITGTVIAPPDKSISHRAVMLAGICNNEVKINNFLFSADTLATVNAMSSVGVKIYTDDRRGQVIVIGKGLKGLSEPSKVIDSLNSGTTMRLISGILACQNFFSILTGDASLLRRPMRRIIEPLRLMGANIVARADSKYPPIAILPAKNIRGIDYKLPVASAQVKSALLFAGLYAVCPTRIIEPLPSRNHTELMLTSFGAKLEISDNTIVVYPPANGLAGPAQIFIPGDISSAAYFIVAALVTKDSEVIIKNVGINPSRSGIIDILVEMGADITVTNKRITDGLEPIADITVRSSKLKAVDVPPECIPLLIDEIPILSVAFLFAEGISTIKGAGELRIKESDRLAVIAEEFAKCGAYIDQLDDGLIVYGGHALHYAECRSHGDHRIAMSLAVLGISANGISITDAECIEVSYPNFYKELELLCGGSDGKISNCN